MDRMPADPAKLLETWMEWERGEVAPGRAMSNFKTAGLRDILEELVASRPAGSTVETADAEAAASWTPST